MARPLRIEYPGAVYHVTARGNNRNPIFEGDGDREFFLKTTGEIVKRFRWICHAFCLMDNHYHLLIETQEPNLSQGMRQLGGNYTQAHNRFHGKCGHLFQGRFKSILVQKDSHLLELCRYIMLNPVRGGIAFHPQEWHWSSYRQTMGFSKRWKFLSTNWILSQFGKKLATARKSFQRFVQNGIDDPNSIWDDVKGQILLGSQTWVASFQDILEDNKNRLEVPRKQRLASRAPLEEIIFPRENPKRNRLIYKAHVKYGYTLKEIADFLDIHYTTVSKIVKQTKAANK